MSALQPNILVSFIMATRNRREALARTLSRVAHCGIDAQQVETIVVDNASTDGTADLVAQRFPATRLIALAWNRGSCAKNFAISEARGRYVIFLDDDSSPQPGSIARMIRHFEADERLGAAVFTVTLPNGSRESSAYPDVFIGCGTGFRRRALQEAGGLPGDFFMQAEEYDLSLRLLAAGWEIRAFDDLHVLHEKTPTARRPARTIRCDVRNNYVLASRYFPPPWRRTLRADWMRRYRMIATSSGHIWPYRLGLLEGMWRAMLDRRRTITKEVFERFARIPEIKQRLDRARQRYGIKRVLLIDYGKNILPYYLAATELDIEIVAVADNALAGAGRAYRGIPIVNDSVARRLEFDAAVISNCSVAHAQARRSQWRELDRRVVIDLFDPSLELAAPPAAGEPTSSVPAESGSHRTAARIA